MGAAEKVVDSFIQYFDAVKNARLAFWLGAPVPAQVEFISAPVTALAFLLARISFAGLPHPVTYGMLIIAYLVVLAVAAGIACLSIPPAREKLGENMRKFISAGWILSTIAAFVCLIENLLGLSTPIATGLFNLGLTGSDLVASVVPSVIVALIAVWLLERSSNRDTVNRTHFLTAVVFLFLAGAIGLGIVLGVGS